MYVTGTLRMNSNQRWEIVYGKGEYDQIELSSGSVIEVKIGEHWIRTSIEFAHTNEGGQYYATTKGIKLCRGLEARVNR